MKAIKHRNPWGLPPWIRFAGDALVHLNNKQQVHAGFVMGSVGGMLPSVLELTVDPKVSDFAFQNGPAITLEVCGVKIRTQIAGQNKKSHVLQIFAAPLLRGLARAMATPDKP
jgi:hypothetical protein